jgi:hypothetical protein
VQISVPRVRHVVFPRVTRQQQALLLLTLAFILKVHNVFLYIW